MKRLIYVSAAPGSFRPSDVSDFLDVSRTRNAANGITGLLIYHDGAFFQVLEGEDDKVSHCFRRICRDRRHDDCRILFDEPVMERAFEGWSMAYRSGVSLDPAYLSQLQDIVEIAGRCDRGDYENQPVLNVFLRTFLRGLRMLDAA